MDNLLGAFWFLRDRWAEPSTHVALSVVCAKLGTQFDASLIQSIFDLASVAFGAAGFFIAEGKALGRTS